MLTMPRFLLLAALIPASAALAACSGGADKNQEPTGTSTTISSSTGSGGHGGDTGDGGAGGGSGECLTLNDCPAPTGACEVATCMAGQCGTAPAADQTPTASQAKGDCKQAVCVGGVPQNIEDAKDTFDDGNSCTVDSCIGDQAANLPSEVGAPCGDNGGKVCNGIGGCVECLTGTDCESGLCEQGKCVPSSCFNNSKDGTESDVDCGGPACPACADGKVCAAGSDCTSDVCSGGTCQAPSCDDGVKNGLETDLDCGGMCMKLCSADQGCQVDADCKGGQCSGTTCLATCTDSEKNGAESDVDCGGATCPGCAEGQMCGGGSDCVTSACSGGVCQAPSCTDGAKNGSETDVDCGGGCPSKCGPDQACKNTSDCASGACDSMAKTCVSTCTDGFKGGDETGVDCGGPSCPSCPVGQACASDTDCETTVCSAMKVCETLNGCDPATAIDLTGESQTTITFASFAYNPPCIRVSPGTKVTWSGSFPGHPLVGGKVVGGMKVPDPASPITPTSTGNTKTFTLSNSGAVPYYCDFHAGMGMFGTIFVQ